MYRIVHAAAVSTLPFSRRFEIAVRLLLTLVFWTSGLAKLIDFDGSTTQMEGFGLYPGWLFNGATAILQIGASAMIVLGRGTWIAVSALAIFTVATIPIAHPFWAKRGEEAFRDMTVALEHVSLIGGLLLAAIADAHRRAADRDGPSRRTAPVATR